MDVKRKLVIGTAALAAVAFAGGAYAATQESTNPRQAFLNDVAKRLKVSPNDLNSALQGAFLDQLQAAVKAGKLTQAQADQLKQRIQQDGVPLGGPLFGPRLFRHEGFGGPGAFESPGGFGGPGLRFSGLLNPGVARYLGLNAEQLRAQLASGKSLAQIAAAQHKSTSGLKAAMIADARSRLDKALSAKMLTRAEEQKILSDLQSRLDTVISRKGIGPHIYRRFGPDAGPGQAPSFAPIPPPGAPSALPAPAPPPAY